MECLIGKATCEMSHSNAVEIESALHPEAGGALIDDVNTPLPGTCWAVGALDCANTAAHETTTNENATRLRSAIRTSICRPCDSGLPQQPLSPVGVGVAGLNLGLQSEPAGELHHGTADAEFVAVVLVLEVPVVAGHHAARPQLGPPGFQVPQHAGVRVGGIDVDEFDRRVGEARCGFGGG